MLRGIEGIKYLKKSFFAFFNLEPFVVKFKFVRDVSNISLDDCDCNINAIKERFSLALKSNEF